MPTSIPYDPSLELANIVPQKNLDVLLNLAKAEAPVAAAQEQLNRAVMTVRSLDMTMSEMINMGVPTSKDLNKQFDKAKTMVQTSAEALISAKLKAYPSITTLQSQLSGLDESLESPVDYNRTVIKKMPLSADSLNLDAQYFSHDGESQGSNSSVAAIGAFVSETTRFLGDKFSTQATANAQRQVSSQIEHHDIEGTLVITASCTHKEAAVLAPLILDVDKAIRVFNRMFPDDMIKTNSVADMAKLAVQQQTKNEKSFNIISGANYGSSFIGMVHILKTNDTSASQHMSSIASSVQEQMDVSCWFAHEEGGIGANSSFANDVKQLLSSQNITSHISLIAMGAIPSIVSSEVQLGVQQFADFDPAKMMGQLATLQNATDDDNKTFASSAQAARTGQTMVAMEQQKVTNVMAGLQKVDDDKNQMMDINTLMTAFEDYVQKASQGDVGVPVNYFIKPITASQLAQMWVAKYYPGVYTTAAGDDSGHSTANGARANGAADTGDQPSAN